MTNAIRRERTRLELDRLKKRIDAWIACRRDQDSEPKGSYVGRHKTQLDTLQSVLTAAATAFVTDLDAARDEPSGAFHDTCRDVDQAIVWLERFWTFYREKFDQRDDDRLKPLLRAADEVVWSCYQEVMGRARKRDRTLTHRPAPLAFIAPEYSPAALDSGTRPKGELVLPGDYDRWSTDLRALLEALPLPLLRLPPWCVDSPWWLVYVAHEVGHHLLADLGLKVDVANGVSGAVKKSRVIGQTEENQWRRWSEEIFADAVAVMLLGEWAVWATAEVEWSTTTRMVEPKRDYPPPLVRLELMSRLAAEHELDGVWGLRGFVPESVAEKHPGVGAYRAHVPDVVAYLKSDLPRGLGTLADLCGFDRAGLYKDVRYWASALRQDDPPRPPRDLRTARHVAAASLAAWAELTAAPRAGDGSAVDARPVARDGAPSPMTPDHGASPDDQAQATAALRIADAGLLAANTEAVLARSGPPGTRSSLQPSGADAGTGDRLAELLRANIRAERASQG